MGVVRNGREEEEEASMEWDKQEEGVLFVKVMTDEQMEILRKQISVYATICEQLVEMHKAITAQQDSLAGMRLGNLYCDPLMATGGQKITARQRWTPTPVQLRILESIFDEGNGTPSKQKIKEITSQLTHHGQISETNVYNWFQNRRARSKRKQPAVPSNNADSEADTDVDSPNEKRAKSENIHSHENPAPKSDDICFQSSEISSQVHSLDPSQPNKAQSTLPLNDNSRSSGGLGHISFYENVNPRIDHFMGKMEGNFNHFRTGEGYDI